MEKKQTVKKPKQESFVERMVPLQLKYNLDMMKQETLEEAAEKFRNENPGTMQGGNNTKIIKAFKEGAKWQQERMYSEEEVLQLLRKSHFVEQNIDEWFEIYKK